MRSLRKLITLWMTVAGLLAIQAVVTAAPAEAAITCKTYTQWTHTDGTVLHDQRICAAPASDYPRYSDWGRLVTRFSTSPLPCEFSIFPYDIDDPQPMIACLAMVRQLDAWRWDGRRWVAADGLYPGQRAYVYPYTADWRWVWTKQSGWVAIRAEHVAYRWLG